MFRSFATRSWFGLVLSLLAGCGGMSDQDRLKALVPNAQVTTPVKGTVLVDGKPVKDLWVKLHPVNAQPDSVIPKAQTDKNGRFQITTYIAGDGAPAGDYKITIEWLTFQQFGSRWSGPNKLEGPCGDVKTTEYATTVEKQPVDLGTYEVKAKSDADQAQSTSGKRAAEKRK